MQVAHQFQQSLDLCTCLVLSSSPIGQFIFYQPFGHPVAHGLVMCLLIDLFVCHAMYSSQPHFPQLSLLFTQCIHKPFLLEGFGSHHQIVAKLYPTWYLLQNMPTMIKPKIKPFGLSRLIQTKRIMSDISFALPNHIQSLNVQIDPMELGDIMLDALPFHLQTSCHPFHNFS